MSMRSAVKNQEDPLSIRDCVERKLNAFKKFYSATESIKNAIDAGEVDQIEGIIQERRKYMDIIDRIDDYMLKTRRDKPAHVSSLNDETRAQIQTLTDGIKKVLGDISALDKECNIAAASRLSILKQELLKVTQNRHDLQHYHASIPQAPRFLDMQL